ncbi:MAG: vitamin K epoxide reductase family protein [Candidatus Micrarchaeota archaeon]|nr:vitamin K epoxide reductase family protein [Candidatus Micrarchaeota archaeon]
MDTNRLRMIALVLAVLGILDGVYLEIDAITGIPVACPNTGVIDCGNVLNSKFADTFGIPNPILGVVFFSVEVILMYVFFNKELLFVYNAIGIAFVIYFLHVEWVVRSICIYCTVTHILVAALFIISLLYLSKK